MNVFRKLFSAPYSLRQRLTISYALAFVIFLGFTFIVLYWSISAILIDRMREDLIEDIDEFKHLQNSSGPASVITEMNKEAAFGENENVFLQLYGTTGQLIHSTDLEYWSDLSFNQSQLLKHIGDNTDNELMLLSLPSRDSTTHTIIGALSLNHVMVIGESADEHDEITELLALVFSLVFLLTLPMTALMVWLITSRAINGIKQVSDAALLIRSGTLDTRVRMTNQVAEIQTLADTFDSMAQRIQTLIHDMREMTDNIAHDLRSPLGRIRLHSESIVNSGDSNQNIRYNAESSIAECDRLINMINVSLDVAETEAGVSTSDKCSVDFSMLVRDACEHFEPIAEQKAINLMLMDCQAVTVLGKTNSLQRMVANVVDNAVKYSASHDSVSISLVRAGPIMVLKIRDTGIGIASSVFETIFRRFYRVDSSRSDEGCGLGLSYARAVARDHDGDITVESIENVFAEFCIVLPVLIPSGTSRLVTE